MENNHKQLTRQFLRYLFPSVASLVSLSCYILADTFFVATGVGSMGLAGLNIALPAYAVINATGLMLGIGAGVVVSVSRGRGDEATANAAASTALAAALVIGLVYTAAGTLLAAPIAELLGASAQSLPYATTYIRTLAGFSVFFLLNNVLVAVVRNDDNPRLSMTAMIACSLSNVVLDAVFILIFGWGMFGAAFATGLAPIISLCILSLHWLKGHNSLAIRSERPRLRLIRELVSGGNSNFLIEVGNGLVIMLFNFTLMSMSGDVGVAAYGIVTNIALVAGYVFIGVGQGIQPLVSRFHGEGDRGSASAILRKALTLSIAVGALFFALGLLFPDQLAALFNGDNNPELAAITVRAIRIYFAAFLFMGVNVCFASYFQSVLRPKTAAVISLARGFALVVAGVAVLPRLLHLDGVWMIVPLAELLTLPICGVGLWLSRRERREKTVLPERNPA